MSLKILAIRHAATTCNQEKRILGRRDIPLSPDGLASLHGKQVPTAFRQADWYCSPLMRARQTAGALGISGYSIADDLIEMDWGDWEGKQLPELRAQLGATMQVEEDRGLDMQPPRGESPRQVQQRLLHWLQGMPSQGRAGIVCHKGVMRALLCLALDWDMLGRCPVKVDWSKAFLFGWLPESGLSLIDHNLPLE
jgi:probable phosphoglycerate mutase